MESNRILELKEEIEEAKTAQAEAKGAMNHIESVLVQDFGCNIKTIENKINSIHDEIDQLDEKIRINTMVLKEKYGIEC